MKNPIQTYLQGIFDIRPSTDYEHTHESIIQGISLKGYNIWMLICSTVLACIGLDTDSAAVIIGAMLISPLMGPILGIGYNVAIQDKEHLIRSLYNFGIATGISLLTAWLYFEITPFGEVTLQLEMRRHPTFLDVMVGLFGGVAGIVAQSRKGIINALPGVAIATALMPPVCTAGFGLGTGRWEFFGGAMYLFLINSFFISFSSYLIIQLLGFPMREYVNSKIKRKVGIWIAVFSILFTAPSIYFLVKSIQDSNYKQQLKAFVDENIDLPAHPVVEMHTQLADTNICRVYTFGQNIKESDIQRMQKQLDALNLRPTKLKIVQSYSLENNEDLNKLLDNRLKDQSQLMRVNQVTSRVADSLQRELGTIKIDSAQFLKLQREVRAAFPELKDIIFAKQAINSKNPSVVVPLFVIDFKRPLGGNERKKLTERLRAYLRERLDTDKVMIVYW